MKVTVNTHRIGGGTFVTNFSKDMWPIYEQALEIYREQYPQDKRVFLLLDVPAAPCPRDGSGALHVEGQAGLSEFWRVFDVVRAVREAEEKTRKAMADATELIRFRQIKL